MRIIYLQQYFGTPSHPGGTRPWSISHLLQQQGHQVTVISGVQDYSTGKRLGGTSGTVFSRQSYDSVNVLRVGFSLPYYHTFLTRIFSYVTFMIASCVIVLLLPKPDILYASSSPISIAIPALLLNWIKRVPIVFEVRDLWPDFPIQYGILRNPILIKLMYALEKITYQRSTAIIATSPWMQQQIVAKGIQPAKVFCIPTGADIDEFRPDLACVRDIRMELNLSELDFLVVYAGSHGIPNALDTLIDATFYTRSNPIHYLLIGDGRNKENLRQQAKRLGVSEKVHFWPACSRKELAPILANADLCVITARGLEAAQAILPNKLFDYLASGTPILVNFSGDTADVLIKAKCGVIVEPENPRALADTLCNLYHNRTFLENMRANARRVAEQDFDRKKLYPRLIDILENSVRPIK